MENFAKAAAKKHAEVRVVDTTLLCYTFKFYVYLYIGDEHVGTSTVEYPEDWVENWPRDDTVREYIAERIDLGGAQITTLKA